MGGPLGLSTWDGLQVFGRDNVLAGDWGRQVLVALRSSRGPSRGGLVLTASCWGER